MKKSRRPHRSTPAGEHVPVLRQEVLSCLEPQPGEVAVDCTLGWGGHAADLLRRVQPGGRLLGIDLDNQHLPRVQERLEAIAPGAYTLHHGNFAGIAAVVGGAGLLGVDVVLADLGMSSLQLDEPERGFSYVREGALDMRMDPTRGRTAAELLATLPGEDLAQALAELGDEPDAERIARAIVEAREERPLERTTDLVQLIQRVSGQQRWRLHPNPGQWNLHPAARTFQALRILVNRELANLTELLRVLPSVLNPGGRAGIISFHSGEDRLVKAALRKGLELGWYSKVVKEPIRPTFEERQRNPRSRSAKLRWAVRSAIVSENS